MAILLYIHGMGGGADSRIPSILSEELTSLGVKVVVRTYDFDPQAAAQQISEWVDELKPALIIGESLGSLHALRIPGVPKLFVSPALNTPLYFEVLSWLVLIPGVGRIFDRIYKPREGDRQRLHFTHAVLKKYRAHRRLALSASSEDSDNNMVFAFFGTTDHYRKSGIVSIRTWKKYFGEAFEVYEGTHFMEEEHVRSLLANKVVEYLNVNK